MNQSSEAPDSHLAEKPAPGSSSGIGGVGMIKLVFCLVSVVAAIVLLVLYVQQVGVNQEVWQDVTEKEAQLKDLLALADEKETLKARIDAIKTKETSQRQQILSVCRDAESLNEFPVTSGELFVISPREILENGGLNMYVPPGHHELVIAAGKSLRVSNDIVFDKGAFRKVIRLPESTVVKWEYKIETVSPDSSRVALQVIDCEGKIYLSEELKFAGEVASSGTGGNPPRKIFYPNQFYEYAMPGFLGHTVLSPLKLKWKSNCDMKNNPTGVYYSVHWEIRSANQPFLPTRLQHHIPESRDTGIDIMDIVAKAFPGVDRPSKATASNQE